MTRPTKALGLGTRLVVIAACAFAVPGSTSALPTAESGSDLDGPRRLDAPSVSSLWDEPASPAPIVVRPPAPPPAPVEHALSANPLWAIPLATLTNMRERPIFSASRRPPPPAIVPVAVAAAPPPPPKPQLVERPQLSLVGTIASGPESFGIFVDQTTKAALRLKLGEDYQGWRLRSVQGRDVTLERDQLTTILSLPQPGTSVTGTLRAQADNALTQGRADPQGRGNRR